MGAALRFHVTVLKPSRRSGGAGADRAILGEGKKEQALQARVLAASMLNLLDCVHAALAQEGALQFGLDRRVAGAHDWV